MLSGSLARQYAELSSSTAYSVTELNGFEFILPFTMLEGSPDRSRGWQKAFFDGAIYRQMNKKPFIRANFSI